MDEIIIRLFEEHEALGKLEPFVSLYGAERYGFETNKRTIKLRRETWTVPKVFKNIVPDLAGREMEWKVVEW